MIALGYASAQSISRFQDGDVVTLLEHDVGATKAGKAGADDTDAHWT